MNFDFDLSNPVMIIGIVAVVLLLVALGIVVAIRKSRAKSENLRHRFGPEYDRLLRISESRKNAEARLVAREKRIELLKIHNLKPGEREPFIAAWQLVQARFVDHPRGAVVDADELINALLKARGFPVERFEQRAADLSVGHAHLVGPYRAANDITVRAGRNAATTEELRMAMVHYHALFDDLLKIDSRYDSRVELKEAV